MAVHIEAQTHDEIMQIRSRELQLENTEKLDQLTPIVENIGEVDLQTMENNTHEIKTMIQTNIDDQIDLDQIAEKLNNITKSQIELKKSVTRLSNSLKDVSKVLEEISSKIDGDTNG